MIDGGWEWGVKPLLYIITTNRRSRVHQPAA
jgi:hypothetical protein